MLRKIRVDQLRIGMHFHGLCASWLKHSVWRTRFVIRTAEELAKLRASGVAECWIDPSRGDDLVDEERSALPSLNPAAVARDPGPEPSGVYRTTSAPTTLDQERERAARICTEARRTVESLMDAARLGRALDTGACVELVDDISASLQRNAAALLGLVRLKTHDDYTFMHSVAVSTLMVALATRMGHDATRIREAGIAGMLHDVGKASIPLAVLNKPGALTAEEFSLVRSHPRSGHEALQRTGTHSAATLDVCLHHHERPDGKGYPDGLQGDALSLLARMGSICDVYDAITSNRPYKDPWGPAESIALMAKWTKEGQFDALVFRAFVDCIGIFPVGSLVRLQSSRLAVVIEQNKASPIAPRVRVFYSLRAQMPIPVETLDLGASGCIDRITARESISTWKFPFLDALSTAAGDPSAPSP